ncbi:MAG: SIMPL domain-containing protein [Bacteroidia bacterium]|nr:SIMPL domain-containing protein [Bacteroidia bacterium]
MKRFFLLMGLLCLSPLSLLAQAKGNIDYQQQDRSMALRGKSMYNQAFSNDDSFTNIYFKNDSTIEIGANVLMNVSAEQYVAILSVLQAGETAKICNETIDFRLRNFTQSMTQNGVTAGDIYIDFISQIPTYQYEIEKRIFSKTANEVPSGFELRKNVHIKFKDIKTLDKIMVLAAEQEIYDLVKVDYYLDQNRLNAVYDSLRNSALAVVERKLKAFQRLNFDFSPAQCIFRNINENLTSVYPVERYASYQAYSKSALKQDLKIEREIQKSSTYYYNKVAYNDYDMVINPILLEPAIQFSYSVQVQYVMKKNENKVE